MELRKRRRKNYTEFFGQKRQRLERVRDFERERGLAWFLYETFPATARELYGVYNPIGRKHRHDTSPNDDRLANWMKREMFISKQFRLDVVEGTLQTDFGMCEGIIGEAGLVHDTVCSGCFILTKAIEWARNKLQEEVEQVLLPDVAGLVGGYIL